ncbi:MAG: RidA family protein [Sediminibacterium sp.]|nr:RidA family protein [Sediminibacterium sp.]
MKRQNFTSGSSFEDEIGYSRMVVCGDMIFVSGVTGFNYTTMTISENIVSQTEQCFLNIMSILSKVDAELSNIVQVWYILPNKQDFKDCMPTLKKFFGEIKPAATLIEAGLLDDRMKIEIQVTAMKKMQ